jgi:hypothetical protein
MNNLQLAIVYAKTDAVALGFISITSNMSPQRRIGMHDSEESSHAFGSNSGSPIRGHGRGRGRGRGRPQHGFAQVQGSPLRQRGCIPYHSPYHSPRGGRGSRRSGQNRSPRGGCGSFNDELFIPRELFEQLSSTQLSILLRGRDVYNSRGGICSRFNCQMIAQLGAFIRASLLHHLDHHQADLTWEAHLPCRLVLNVDAALSRTKVEGGVHL